MAMSVMVVDAAKRVMYVALIMTPVLKIMDLARLTNAKMVNMFAKEMAIGLFLI